MPPPKVPPSHPPPALPPAIVPIIIDTDMSFDVDDVGAVCLAHALARRGEAHLVAVLHNTGLPEGVGALSTLSAYYGHDVPLGAYKGPFGVDRQGTWIAGSYVPNLVAAFPSNVTNSSQVPPAVDVYRRALADAADGSVVIVSIGFATNLAALLKSPPDAHSNLTGEGLVGEKVKLVAWQGGWYEPLHPNGLTTFNWDCGVNSGFDTSLGCAGDAGYAVANIPTGVEQMFSDLGDDVWHGAALTTCSNSSNPCRQAYIDTLGEGRDRASWDPIVVLAAVRGAAAVAARKVGQGHANRVDADGANFWELTNASTLQSHLAWEGEPPWAEARAGAGSTIDELLCEHSIVY